MVLCNFCGIEINKGRGLKFVKADGAISHFCSSKCEKNLKLKRNPRKVNWVKKVRK